MLEAVFINAVGFLISVLLSAFLFFGTRYLDLCGFSEGCSPCRLQNGLGWKGPVKDHLVQPPPSFTQGLRSPFAARNAFLNYFFKLFYV